MEQVNCDLCGKDDTKLLFTARDLLYKIPGEFKVVKCKNCGLVYINPRPTKAEILQYYPNNYREHKATKWWSWSPDVWLLNDLPKGRVLDVGCGSGTYLNILRKKGWDTYGVDISATAVEHARNVFGLNVQKGEIFDLRFPNNFFDVCTMIHTLEHMHTPSGVLKKVYSLLKENGTLMIGVPNYECIERAIFKRYWAPLEVPRHLYHFSVLTLRKLVDKCGFTTKNIYFPHAPDVLINSFKFYFKENNLCCIEQRLNTGTNVTKGIARLSNLFRRICGGSMIIVSCIKK